MTQAYYKTRWKSPHGSARAAVKIGGFEKEIVATLARQRPVQGHVLMQDGVRADAAGRDCEILLWEETEATK